MTAQAVLDGFDDLCAFGYDNSLAGRDLARAAPRRLEPVAARRFRRVVHVHGNNCAAYAIVGGMPVPAVLEVTFAQTAGKTFARSRRTFPTALDRPNDPGVADHALGLFHF